MDSMTIAGIAFFVCAVAIMSIPMIVAWVTMGGRR